MRIAFIGHKAVPSRLGGVEIHVEEISTRLSQKGHEVDVYNRKVYDKGLKKYKGINLYSVFTVNKNSLEALIYSFLASIRVMFKRYDIVHYHALGPSVMSFLPRLTGKKVIVTVHGLDWQRSKWKGLATAYLKLGEYASARFANHTISVSKTLVPYYKGKYKKEIEYIPNGISLNENIPLNGLEKLYGINKDKYILFVARLVPEKGCHYLIEAFKNINTDMNLVIAGDNPYNLDYVNSLKEASSSDERIKMIGFQDMDSLSSLYSNTYAYVLPSDIEGLPISLLEAMSFGCLCIVSDIDENLAVLENDGLCFKKGDINSLREVLEDVIIKDFKYTENFNSYKLSEKVRFHYNWDEVTNKTEQSYRKVLGKH